MGKLLWQQCLAAGPCRLREIAEKTFSSKYMSHVFFLKIHANATSGKHIWLCARGHLLYCLILVFAFLWKCLFNATSGAKTGGEVSKTCSVSSGETGPSTTVFSALSGKSLPWGWSGDGKVTEPWDPRTYLQTDTRLGVGYQHTHFLHLYLFPHSISL